MKNLANCTPSEFLVQTNRIRKAAEKWLDATKLFEIWGRLPEPAATGEGLEATEEETKKRIREQRKKNRSDLLDAILEKHPQETLELIALCCFVEPEDLDGHKMTECLDSIMDMLEDPTVLRFFTLFTSRGQKNIS